MWKNKQELVSLWHRGFRGEPSNPPWAACLQTSHKRSISMIQNLTATGHNPSSAT